MRILELLFCCELPGSPGNARGAPRWTNIVALHSVSANSEVRQRGAILKANLFLQAATHLSKQFHFINSSLCCNKRFHSTWLWPNIRIKKSFPPPTVSLSWLVTLQIETHQAILWICHPWATSPAFRLQKHVHLVIGYQFMVKTPKIAHRLSHIATPIMDAELKSKIAQNLSHLANRRA